MSPTPHRFAEILRRGIPTAQNDERGVGLVADHPGATIHPITVQPSQTIEDEDRAGIAMRPRRKPG